jgi:SAM-dependent MidA family methyltransferase
MKVSTEMNPLEQKITERIKNEGPITFETFMEMALYEPGLGYYASENIEIGKAGDFYTSQHLHPAFGSMIGKQLEEMWEVMGRPSEFYAVEPGAGAGLMCMDIMDYLHKREIFSSFSYIIAELNPSLQNKQQRLLGKFPGKVRWIYSLRELRDIKGCILSNELLDAFPVHLIEMDDELKEIFVIEENGNFCETKNQPSSSELEDYLTEFSLNLPNGYRTEINLRIRDWLKSVNAILSEGFVLTIDYGYPAWDYYSEDRNRGTLLCYYRHQLSEDPFRNIGEQDITAHVNFSSVKKWGEDLGFETLGFCQQGAYLISLGIDKLINELYTNSSDYLFEVAKIKRLIFPGTIGETHKVMIQYKGKGKPGLKGFSIKNHAEKL